MPGRAYDAQTKEWSFPVDAHAEVIQKLHSIPGVEVKPLPATVLKAMTVAEQAANVSGTSERDVAEALKKLPTGLMGALMPFQREGVSFAVAHGGRALIGDEVSIGIGCNILSLRLLADCC